MLVVGVGNPDRGDDGAGPAVADRIAALALPGVRVVRLAEPARLLEVWDGESEVLIVDSLRGGASPVVVLEAADRSLPAWSGVSTHGLGVASVVELARSLRRLPERLTVVGVAGSRFEPGTGLSSEAAGAVAAAVEVVRRRCR